MPEHDFRAREALYDEFRQHAGPASGHELRGRGATGNPGSRFEKFHVELEPVDPTGDPEEDERPKLQTQFFRDGTKTIIARNNSPDVSFETSVNPYRGCEHGCICLLPKVSREHAVT